MVCVCVWLLVVGCSVAAVEENSLTVLQLYGYMAVADILLAAVVIIIEGGYAWWWWF